MESIYIPEISDSEDDGVARVGRNAAPVRALSVSPLPSNLIPHPDSSPGQP
jgi:hypothetical protein